MTLAEAITKFSIEVLQLEETKKSPEMVTAITELLKLEYISNYSLQELSKTQDEDI